MKKYLFIIGFVGTALFTACSTADDLISEKPIETPPVEEPKETAIIVEASQDSDVPITLGVGSSRGVTRQPIESGAGNTFSTEDKKYLGVFCLATGTQSNVDNIPSEISTNKWVKDDATGLLVRLSNVPAKVVAGNVTFMDPDDLSAVTPTETTKHYYYPMGNWMVYNFYAYYPRETDENISFTKGGSGVLVKYITIDGSQDVIWGKAYPETADPVDPAAATDADPYCAKYIRLKGTAGYPNLEFKHLLARFNFSIEPKDGAAWTAIDGMGGMEITDMYISKAISSLQLIVANKANPGTEGTLSKKDGTTGNLSIKANDKDYNLFSSTTPLESQVSSIAIASTSVTVPGYIMLPPTGVGTEDYELCLNYSIGGEKQKEPMRVKMIPPVVPSSDPVRKEFEAGRLYNISIKVQSPQEISATATLASWGGPVDVDPYTVE